MQMLIFASLDGAMRDQPLLCFSFSRNPLTDIQRAVSDFGPVRFVECQELYSLAVHETDVPEIDGHCLPFLFQQGLKHIHFLPCNPSADAQDHKILSDNKPVNSAGHFLLVTPHPAAPSFSSRGIANSKSKLFAIRNLLKTNGQHDVQLIVNWCNNVNV